jgi:hypothetical protein
MGRWDENKKSQERNKKINEYFVRFNSIMYKFTPKFLLKIDQLLQKKVQRYVKIVSPTQYLLYVLGLFVCSFIVSDADIPLELGVILQISILIVIFLLRASFGGGHRKKKDVFSPQ